VTRCRTVSRVGAERIRPGRPREVVLHRTPLAGRELSFCCHLVYTATGVRSTVGREAPHLRLSTSCRKSRDSQARGEADSPCYKTRRSSVAPGAEDRIQGTRPFVDPSIRLQVSRQRPIQTARQPGYKTGASSTGRNVQRWCIYAVLFSILLLWTCAQFSVPLLRWTAKAFAATPTLRAHCARKRRAGGVKSGDTLSHVIGNEWDSRVE